MHALLLTAALVILPGHEADIARLFAPPLPDGCVAGDVRIDSDRVRTRLSCGGKTLSLELVHPSKAPQAPRTANFALVVPDAPGLAASLAQTLGPRDEGSPWSLPPQPLEPAMPPLARMVVALLLVAWPLFELVRALRQRRATTR